MTGRPERRVFLFICVEIKYSGGLLREPVVGFRGFFVFASLFGRFMISGESTTCVYNYRTERLTCTCNIFYTETASGLIINDYGTEVVIE